MRTFSGNSATLITTPLRTGEPVRATYLKLGPTASSPPILSVSPFVPLALVEHLMRNKKDTAIAVKFSTSTGRDAITNMEGAMHTYVTPLVLINLHGDYEFKGIHTVNPFDPAPNGMQQARVVVMSAMVHPDFELTTVMYEVARLGSQPVDGQELGREFTIPSVEDRQDPKFREAYDDKLRRHMIKHLTEDGRLPAASAVTPMSYEEAVAFLSNGGSPIGRYVSPHRNSKGVISLELLFFSAIQQVSNEFSALEALCPNGYVYTFDPPAIFAKTLGAALLNRLFIAALAHVARLNTAGFKNMRVFAFNDYADPTAVGLAKEALEGHQISVVTKSSLFPPPRCQGPPRYVAPSGSLDALLVLHNNSDAFGQNIENEGDGGSMDGAIGCHSNAAACLHRGHQGLLDQVLVSMKLKT